MRDRDRDRDRASERRKPRRARETTDSTREDGEERVRLDSDSPVDILGLIPRTTDVPILQLCSLHR